MVERVAAEVFSPGEYVKEFLEGRSWTQDDLATILGRPSQLVSNIVLGKRGITPETAKGLAEAFGTSAQLWLNLDAAWQLYNARNTQPDPAIKLRASIYSKGPIKEMVNRGWIELSSNPEVLEQRVLDFYQIESLEDPPPVVSAAARMSSSYDELTPAQRSWMCRARQLGGALSVSSKFETNRLDDLLTKLRALLVHPEDLRHVPGVLAEFGIRFLVLEHLARTKIDGACLWLDEQSPIISLSLRYDRIDYFWFTLMHELRHAVVGDGRNAFVALDRSLVGEHSEAREDKPAYEVSADEFAEEALIPQAELDDFVDRKGPLFSEKDIRGFASLHQVHPGLVVGQLHYHHRGMTYSKLRRLLVKIRDQVTATSLTDGWGHAAPPVPR